jgi:hypothetical protein
VWLRIQDSGTRQRFANSAESINSTWFPLLRDINGTSAVSRFMFSLAYRCTAVTLTAPYDQLLSYGASPQSEQHAMGAKSFSYRCFVLLSESHARPALAVDLPAEMPFVFPSAAVVTFSAGSA